MNVISGEKRRIKYDTILTTMANNQPRRLQIDNVVKWMPATGYVQIVGDVGSIGHVAGLEVVTPANDTPTLKEALVSYMARNRYTDYDVVAFSTTNLILGTNPMPMFEFLESHPSGRAWAFYVKGPVAGGSQPEFFVTTSIVLDYLVKSIPGDLTMDGQEWSFWLNEWFGRNLPPHRYHDGTNLGLVLDRLMPIAEPESIFSVNAFANQTREEVGMVPRYAPISPADAVSLPLDEIRDDTPAPDTPKENKPVKTQKKRGRKKGWRKVKTVEVAKETIKEDSNGEPTTS